METRAPRVRVAYQIDLGRIPKSIAEALAQTLPDTVDFEAYEIYDPAIDEYTTLAEWFEGFYIISATTTTDGEVYVIAGLDVPDFNHIDLVLYVFTPE